MSITVNTGADTGDWDLSLPTFDGASFCHQRGWASVLESTLGSVPFLATARDDEGNIRGVLPLYRVRSLLMGDRLFSVPFLNAGGAAGTKAAREALTRWALSLAKELGVSHLELRTLMSPPAEITETSKKITVVMELPSDPEVLFKDRLKAKLRSQIRRPQKEGMQFTCDPGNLMDFYTVFARNMRDLGTPVLPRRFFSEALATFPEQTLVGAVRAPDGTTVAAGLGFLWNGEFEITWASSLREYNRFSPNMLLYWGLMEECIGRGAERFNFGRCSPGSPTHRFKRQWGAEDLPLPWGQWTRDGQGEGDYGASPMLAKASEVWKRLPLSVANQMGPWLARQLP